MAMAHKARVPLAGTAGLAAYLPDKDYVVGLAGFALAAAVDFAADTGGFHPVHAPKYAQTAPHVVAYSGLEKPALAEVFVVFGVAISA